MSMASALKHCLSMLLWSPPSFVDLEQVISQKTLTLFGKVTASQASAAEACPAQQPQTLTAT